MRNTIISILIPGLAIGGSLFANPAGRLQVAVSPAPVEIERQAPGRRLLTLPALDFAMRIQAECGADSVAETVSISVADSRLTINREALGSAPTVEQTVRVPQQQIAPLSIDKFCLIDENAGSERERLIDAVLSAQLSLKCVSETGHTVLYQSMPLAISLTCKAPDQSSESAVTARF